LSEDDLVERSLGFRKIFPRRFDRIAAAKSDQELPLTSGTDAARPLEQHKIEPRSWPPPQKGEMKLTVESLFGSGWALLCGSRFD